MEQLDFSDAFSGTRHVVQGTYNDGKVTVSEQGSWLESDGTYSKSSFIRNETVGKYHFGKNWVGGSVRMEDNTERIKATNELSALSQRFTEFGGFIGRGDSTSVYVELGYLQRANDSLVNNILQKVNTSRSYYLKSRLIKTEKAI